MSDLKIVPVLGADTGGPVCGTAEALTNLYVRYTAGGSEHASNTMHCCYRHIPVPQAFLPADAVIEEVSLLDIQNRADVTAAQAVVIVDGDGLSPALMLCFDERSGHLTVSAGEALFDMPAASALA